MTFIYSHSEKKVVQKATMEKPVYPMNGTPDEWSCYSEELRAYKEHLASLQSYPAEGFTKEQDGKEVEVRLQWQRKDYSKEYSWFNIDKDTYDVYGGIGDRRIIALPVEVKEEPHKCQYCGAMTTQSDDVCWNNPKNHKFAEGEDDMAGEFHEANKCTHEGLVDTGVGYYHCEACNKGWTYEEWKRLNPTLPTDKTRLFTLENMIDLAVFMYAENCDIPYDQVDRDGVVKGDVSKFLKNYMGIDLNTL